MTGRPRTRHAKAIAAWLIHELETGGPGTLSELIARIGYGDQDALTAQQVAVTNMAVREFLRGPIAIDPWTGQWHYHQPGTRAPWRARKAS